MRIIGLSAEEQSEIFRMLAIILWLGNVQFQEKDDGNSEIADSGVTDFVAYLMEVDPALVQKVLTSKVVETQRGGRRGSAAPRQASFGRAATDNTSGFASRKAWPTPINVPPVPTPITKASGETSLGSCPRISGPSHVRFSSTFHSDSNWWGAKYPG